MDTIDNMDINISYNMTIPISLFSSKVLFKKNLTQKYFVFDQLIKKKIEQQWTIDQAFKQCI